jgi:hypothetical protein
MTPGPAQVKRQINQGIEAVNVGFRPDGIVLIGHLFLLKDGHEILKRGHDLMAQVCLRVQLGLGTSHFAQPTWLDLVPIQS